MAANTPLSWPQPRLSWPCRIIVVSSVVYAAMFLYFVAATAVHAPVYDYLDWVRAYLDALQSGDWTAYLWAPHSEHRIVISRILVAADIRWLNASHLAFTATGLLLLAGLVAAIARLVVASTFDVQTRIIALAALLFLLLPSTIATMCSMPANQVFLHQAGFAAFAIMLAERPSPGYVIAANIAACLAALGGAGGLLVWPVLAILAGTSRRGAIGVAVHVVVGSIFAALYLPGLPHAPLQLSLEPARLLALADYFIRFFGLPWSHASHLVWPARLIGVTVLCAAGLSLIRRSDSELATSRIGKAMILYALLLGAAATLARSSIATDREMPIRYVLFVALMHVGILLAALPLLAKWLAPGRDVRWQYAAAAASFVLLTQQALAGHAAIAETERYRSAWARFSTGAWSPDMNHYIYPDQARALSGLREISKARLYGLSD
jgi:hypothetical protein